MSSEKVVDHENPDNLACHRLRIELKRCMLKTKCCQKELKTPLQCLREDNIDNDECRKLSYAFFECKRSLIDMRVRFRGHK